jgi:hypothetical protein
MTAPFGPDFDPLALGIVKHVTVETSDKHGTHLLVTFWDRGALAVRAKLGEALTIDVRPAPKPKTVDEAVAMARNALAKLGPLQADIERHLVDAQHRPDDPQALHNPEHDDQHEHHLDDGVDRVTDAEGGKDLANSPVRDAGDEQHDK